MEANTEEAFRAFSARKKGKMMDKGKDLLGQVFLVCRYNSIMVSALGNGMLTLLPVFKLIVSRDRLI